MNGLYVPAHSNLLQLRNKLEVLIKDTVMNRRSAYIWGYTLSIISALSFSTKGVIAKLLYAHGMEPVGLLALRYAIATPFFIAMLFIFPSERVRAHDILILALSGLLGIYLAGYADFYGLMYLEASLERLIVYTYPVIVLLLSSLFFKHRLSRSIIVPLVITYTGLAIALEAFSGGLGGSTGLGTVLVLIAALLFALSLVITESLGKRVSSVKISALTTTAAAAAFITTFFIKSAEGSLSQSLPSSAEAWALLILIGTFATFVPILTIVLAIKRIGASRTAMISFIGPVSTAIIARIFLGEELGTAKLVGMVILILGVYLITRSKEKG